MIADIERALHVAREGPLAASTSDLHLEGDQPPWQRVDGRIQARAEFAARTRGESDGEAKRRDERRPRKTREPHVLSGGRRSGGALMKSRALSLVSNGTKARGAWLKSIASPSGELARASAAES